MAIQPNFLPLRYPSASCKKRKPLVLNGLLEELEVGSGFEPPYEVLQTSA